VRVTIVRAYHLRNNWILILCHTQPAFFVMDADDVMFRRWTTSFGVFQLLSMPSSRRYCIYGHPFRSQGIVGSELTGLKPQISRGAELNFLPQSMRPYHSVNERGTFDFGAVRPKIVLRMRFASADGVSSQSATRHVG